VIKARLTMAADFKKDKKTPHTVETRFVDGTWYIYKCGPGYSNTYKVTEFDDAGLELLRQHQQGDSK
jgi:hypothetical protein